MSRVIVGLLAGLIGLGCVTRSSFEDLEEQHAVAVASRDELSRDVERLQIERDGYEARFLEAQESYEDERVAREALARELASTAEQATRLDGDLEKERVARMEAASELAKREAQLASIQNTYTQLVGDLESEVSAGQIEIERLREGLRLNVSDDVLFASGSAELDQVGREVLVKVAARLKEIEDFIEVRGNTDDRPIRGSLAARFPSNWELAAARAARVVRLLEEHGVPGNRLAVVSLGPNDPVVPNDSTENRALNRRIEIRLEPRPPSGLKTAKE